MSSHQAPPSSSSFQIHPVRSREDLKATVTLFTAYADSLGIDLSFQNFAAEMAAMPGAYAPPLGELLLARTTSGMAIGCVGLRSLKLPWCCEMKRLYVAPEGRGLGVGKALVDSVVEEAAKRGYKEMMLDTLPTMGGAIRLYEKGGFVRTEPYYQTPLEGTIFLARGLEA